MTMRIAFNGRLSDEAVVRVGFIGCGSHSFRNLYPTLQFAPVKLAATCDLDLARAEAFARQFGAEAWYGDYRRMLAEAELDAVLICAGYDQRGRPLYPDIVVDCLSAGRHVWFEKPPAASCAEIERMQRAAAAAGRNVVVGLKKMFFPANEKARELMYTAEFGRPHLVTIQYPQYVPTAAEFGAYARGEPVGVVKWFLDHLCHPVSLLVYLLGMPQTLYYERSEQGGGAATFTFADGAVAVVSLTAGASSNGGMERTMIVGEKGRHITVENNTRVTLHRKPPVGYGDAPTYYVGGPETANTVWEPEFSLGQLYNKGLFLLGYYGEINEFARSILEQRPPAKGTLEQAWQVTRIFEGFAEGASRRVAL
jgi:predicted dehydrogenase